MLTRTLRLVFALLPGIAISAPLLAAETEAEETERYTREAVQRVVGSHDNAIMLKGGELMVKQQAVQVARKLLAQVGREQALGPRWGSARTEWNAAKDELMAVADEVLKAQMVNDAWLKRIWTKYTEENFDGEQASVIADHFETEGGIKQRRLMDWYLGEITVFYFTFTNRFDYELEETRNELFALQQAALTRIPREDVHFSNRNPEAYAFIACSPDSDNCPGLAYWKMLTIPMLGAVFRHMEETSREIEARMRARLPSIQRHVNAFLIDMRG